LRFNLPAIGVERAEKGSFISSKSGCWPYLKCLLVGGRAMVEDDRIPGVDLVESGRQARTAVRALP
jgi:hypothetical protein